MTAPAVAASGLVFAYGTGAPALDLPSFEAAAGERVFVRGASGSGKSTLLGLIAGVLPMQSGALSVLGADMAALGAAKRDAFRADRLGVIFQQFNLLPYLSLIGNVALGCRFSSARRDRAEAKSGSVEAEAARLLSRLGLDPAALAGRSVRDLSVGQQQRVAAARALIGAPGLILADEPTSALDADSRDAFLALLMEEATEAGASLLFVSHDSGLASRFDRVVDLGEANRAASKAAA